MATTEGSAPKRHLRILLVEDHTATGHTMANLLRNRGHEVSVATNGAHAVVLAGKTPFDLLLSDLGLPDIHGWALLERVRALQPQIRAIALSGFGNEHDIQRSKQAGFELHLVKPIRMSDVDAAILSLIPDAAVVDRRPGNDPRRFV